MDPRYCKGFTDRMRKSVYKIAKVGAIGDAPVDITRPSQYEIENRKIKYIDPRQIKNFDEGVSIP